MAAGDTASRIASTTMNAHRNMEFSYSLSGFVRV
jgi:hypothetical protein